MSKVPIDVKKLLESVADIGQQREAPVYVDIVFDPTASEQLVDCVLDAFAAGAGNAYLETVVLGTTVPEIPVPADLCVVVGGDSVLLGDVASAARSLGVPAVVVVQRGKTLFSDDPQAVRELARLTYKANEGAGVNNVGAPAVGKGIPLSDIVDVDFVDASKRPLEELGQWIVANAPAKRVAMAAAFPFLRHPLAVELGRQNAIQNGAIGVVFFIPGADMPIITLNQARMVVQIAAIYGRPLDKQRIKEVVAVVLGGFGFRALARKLAGSVPVLGWAIKPAVAAGATIALSYAAIDYFEEGGALNSAADALGDVLSKASDAVEEAVEKRQAGKPSPDSVSSERE